MTGDRTLKDRLSDLDLLIDFATPQEHRQEARALVHSYEGDSMALHVFHSFYSFLPEGQDDAVVSLRFIAAKDGIFLLCLSSLLDHYVYAGDHEKAEFLGPLRDGIWEEEVHRFFGTTREGFLKRFGKVETLSVYEPISTNDDRCRICYVFSGEFHRLGCPAEICPWCGGQLTYCNCRFDQANLPPGASAEDRIDQLTRALARKGRIPFSPSDQQLGYPGLTEAP